MCLKRNITYLVLIIPLVAGQVGDVCSYENGEGICVKVLECNDALRSIVESGITKLPRCGFEKNIEIICCPQPEDSNENRVADRECKNIADKYGPITAQKVIGGEEASEGEFPHMVALAYPEGKSTYQFLCGGSLISDRHILTAAHCIRNLNASAPVFARVGVLDISNTRFNNDTDYTIDTAIMHPDYKRIRHYNDLAIIRLSTPVAMSDIVFPACLYTKKKDPTMQLEITGWGANNVVKSDRSKVLLKGKLSVVPNEICKRSYKMSLRMPKGIINTQMCAQNLDKQIDACQGDSGGPLQGMTSNDSYYRLVGIVSLGIGCATTVPGVYTRISEYLDWIESIVWPN